MQLNISKIPESKLLLIPVASQNLDNDCASDVSTIHCGERVFKSHTHFSYNKTDTFPSALFRLALGFDLIKDQIWKQYPQSHRIVFFVCEEVTDDTPKEETKSQQSDDLPDFNE